MGEVSFFEQFRFSFASEMLIFLTKRAMARYSSFFEPLTASSKSLLADKRIGTTSIKENINFTDLVVGQVETYRIARFSCGSQLFSQKIFEQRQGN
jgi:hypothetical protein